LIALKLAKNTQSKIFPPQPNQASMMKFQKTWKN